MALPAEMGLYFDFDVTEDGIPYGCPGFEIFDSVHFNMSKLKYIMDHWFFSNLLTFLGYQNMFSTLPISPGSSKRYKADPHCELNSHQEPAGSTPLHGVFEEYANEQDSWIEHFVPTLEKLLSNGYSRYIILHRAGWH